MYSRDLAFVHDAAFSDFSLRVAPAIVRILRKNRILRGRIVEVGCGSGVLARALLAAGYELVGYDVSRDMIRLARLNAPGATFRVASLTAARVPRCDAVVCIGEVVTYVKGGLSALSRFFTRVHDALPPGGVFIFDFLHTARGRTYRTKTIGGKRWSLAVRADYNRRTRTLTRRMAMVRQVDSRSRHTRETHTVRVYDRSEIAAALARAGFTFTIDRMIGRVPLIAGDSAVVARRV